MEEIEEVWKECGEGDRCTYFISNLGRVKSITKVNKKERVLKLCINKFGYLLCDINKKKMKVHTLVAYAFLGPRPEGLEIDHFDRNKLNNKADNLRYITRSKNMINREHYRHDILEQGSERKKIFDKEQNKKRVKKKYTCICGATLLLYSKSYHETSKKHLDWLKNNS